MSAEIKMWKPLTDKPEPPRRRPNDVGTIGNPIRLQANFFQVEMKNQDKTLIHYHVDIKEYVNGKLESVQPKKKRLQIFETMRKKKQYEATFKDAAIGFDSRSNAYSVGLFSPELEKDGKVFKVKLPKKEGENMTYHVSLKVVNKERLEILFQALRRPADSESFPLNTFQMLEVLLHHFPSVEYEKIGRNSFFSLGEEFGRTVGIGGSKEVVVGFFESLRPVGWKDNSLLLNIDVANAAVYIEQNIIDFMRNEMRFKEEDLTKPLDGKQLESLKQKLKDLKIQVTHTPLHRKYKVNDVSPFGPDLQEFPLDCGDGRRRQITVEDYFLERYDRTLKYPRLNCLKVGPEEKNVYLPIEVCKIAKGQKVKKKLFDSEMAQYIRGTAKVPYERLKSIRNVVKTRKYNDDPILKALEFSVSDQPVSLDGRVIPAPKLRMNQEFEPNKGVWDPRGRTFFQPADMKTWVVANYDGSYIDEETLWRFLDKLMAMGKERGMDISDPALVGNFHNPEKDLPEIKQDYPNTSLILVVVPNNNCYHRVKKVGDREVKILTQCVKRNTVWKCSPPTVSNILLKINAKLGGMNNVLGQVSRPMVFDNPVMIMGADVNHPPADDKTTPSFAAVVASMDYYACKYASEVRHQQHRTEMIQDLKEMTKNLLLTFYRKNKGNKPKRIIMYRDGVSDSRFLEVLSFELKAMRAACTELQEAYKPGMTFIVVQKRHHTRLFCHERDGIGQSKNIPPGTTVDNTITHPAERDFYLCSHQGIQGTSRPAHYHVLWDDNDLTMDQLQTMTYAMCHLYSRCTRSVSLPTPAYYAHLVAFRAKVHIRDLCPSETSSVSSGETEAVALPYDILSQVARIDLQDDIASKLYFV